MLLCLPSNPETWGAQVLKLGKCCCRVIRPEAGVGQEDSAPDAHHQEGSGATAERRLSRRQVSIDQLHHLLILCTRALQLLRSCCMHGIRGWELTAGALPGARLL